MFIRPSLIKLGLLKIASSIIALVLGQYLIFKLNP